MRVACGGYAVDGLWSARLEVWVGLDLNRFSTQLGVRAAVAEGLALCVDWQGGEPPSLPSVYGGKSTSLSKFLSNSHNPVPSIPPFFSFV